jgi:hypothetical protein
MAVPQLGHESIVERFYLINGFERLSAARVAGNLDLIHV